MKHIESYRAFESKIQEGSFFDLCELLLLNAPLWQAHKNSLDQAISLVIDTKSKRQADAHFNRKKSNPNKIVVEAKGLYTTAEEKGTLAHELIHALQYLTKTEGDLAFITDITRELKILSDNLTWQKLIYAIYISCPQETEAWAAGILYDRPPILKKMIPWMESFNPPTIYKELKDLKPKKNPWHLTSFNEIPQFFAEVYESYNEPSPGSQIPNFINSSLPEFLNHYSPLFMEAARNLK